jgi:hypothetical protein
MEVRKGSATGTICAFTIWGSQDNNNENSNGYEGNYRHRPIIITLSELRTLLLRVFAVAGILAELLTL